MINANAYLLRKFDMVAQLSQPELDTLDISYREIFMNIDCGTPNNISQHGASQLSKLGAIAWNKWREENPVQTWATLQLGPADYSGFRMPPGVTFSEIYWTEKALFNGTIFLGDISFKDAKFFGDADFSNVVFKGKVNFDGVLWGKKKFVVFTNTVFHKSSEFNSSPWEALEKRLIDGIGGIDYGEKYTLIRNGFSTDVFPSIDFVNAVFMDRVSFNGREFSEADFSNTIFHVVPQFFGVKFHQKTIMKNTKFPSGKKTKGSAISEYRVLKIAFSELKNTQQELYFFRRELTEEIFLSRGGARIFLQLYKILSDFGCSVFKPLSWLIFFSVAFSTAMLYIAWDSNLWFAAPLLLDAAYWKTVNWELSFKYGSYFLGNFMPFFGGGKFDSQLICSLFGGGPTIELVKIFSFIQQCVSLVFWFLIGLALRNMFKMK